MVLSWNYLVFNFRTLTKDLGSVFYALTVSQWLNALFFMHKKLSCYSYITAFWWCIFLEKWVSYVEVCYSLKLTDLHKLIRIFILVCINWLALDIIMHTSTSHTIIPRWQICLQENKSELHEVVKIFIPSGYTWDAKKYMS